MKTVALVPARSGSTRVKDKNIFEFEGEPLLGRAIRVARESGVFAHVFCVTDSPKYAQLAEQAGADQLGVLRPSNVSHSESPDIDWMRWFFNLPRIQDLAFERYAILRPTSPFRSSRLIKSGFETLEGSGCHSVRAVEKVSQHPGKMWIVSGKSMNPLLPFKSSKGVPWHSCQSNTLPLVYTQNASFECGYVENIVMRGSISGDVIAPLFTEGLEGFDINEPSDIELLTTLSNN